jgi:hypothetical protein
MELMEDLDPEHARTMLAEIYNLFTEGFDTVDLKKAKALLEELAKIALKVYAKQFCK